MLIALYFLLKDLLSHSVSSLANDVLPTVLIVIILTFGFKILLSSVGIKFPKLGLGKKAASLVSSILEYLWRFLRWIFISISKIISKFYKWIFAKLNATSLPKWAVKALSVLATVIVLAAII